MVLPCNQQVRARAINSTVDSVGGSTAKVMVEGAALDASQRAALGACTRAFAERGQTTGPAVISVVGANGLGKSKVLLHAAASAFAAAGGSSEGLLLLLLFGLFWSTVFLFLLLGFCFFFGLLSFVFLLPFESFTAHGDMRIRCDLGFG
ncbi:hypothetical protein T492DRAFT_445249 [Pavlovales sp. CCMP2436]|nr:hypothetical protein T492DRAFT_445249 [Pavlovales sp. CCMP2436]